jgi:hypothetical protein
MGQLLRHSAALSLFLALAGFAYAQEPTPAPAPTPVDNPLPAPTSSSKPLSSEPRVGIGVKASFLGGGVEGAVRVNRFANVRGGFNLFSYSRDFHKDSITYNGQLDFKTVEGHFDIFPFAGKFHVSPGVLAYIGNPITATAAVPGGQSFTLGGQTYYSDPNAPTTGNGNIKFNQVSPMATFGWGNLVPRKHAHFSVPFELGAVFQGSPKATLGLAGNVCDALQPVAVNCRPVASDPTVLSNVVSEQNKLNNSMSFFKIYPIISIGFGYAF